jgi:rubrerythrin
MYYKRDGVEYFYEEEYDKLFVKNKRGQLFLVNKSPNWAKTKSRDVMYTTADEQSIIRASDPEKRRVNKKIRRERDDEAFMSSMIASGWLQMLKKSQLIEPKTICPACGALCGTHTEKEEKKV